MRILNHENELNGLKWIRADTSLMFGKKKRSYLRITNFIPKTFIIIISEINYFKLVLKNAP